MKAVIEKENRLQILNQRALPTKYEYIEVNDIQGTFDAIKEMYVRGAPMISVVGCLGIKLELLKRNFQEVEQLKLFVQEQADYIVQSRPTAVNLKNDTEKLVKFTIDSQQTDLNILKQDVINFIDKIQQDYEDESKYLCEHGANIVKDHNSQQGKQKLRAMTICNTGKFATPGDGTALGVIRELHRRGQLEHLYILETRPYNQGSRLTAVEALSDNIPCTLICDSMSGFLMSQKKVDFVITGADRVTKNGDTANKIGTYNLAVLANYHQIPFYVALPSSTIDLNKNTGNEIVIEERPREEMIQINGTYIAPKDINVWNPCFDVTPSNLITDIITEKGSYSYDPKGSRWQEMNSAKLEDYLYKNTSYFDKKTDNAQNLEIIEVGDGNLNLVFIVKNKNNPSQALVVKQALPYVRCVGESWPLSLDRAYFEYQALTAEYYHCPEYVPKIYHFNRDLALIVMEYLAPPHIILRKGLIQGIKYPKLANDLGNFVAKTFFFTSGLHLSAQDIRINIQKWSQNDSLCNLTEQVIFSDPYVESQFNRNTPELDEFVKGFKRDQQIVQQIAHLRHKFIHYKQALIHGDLHTGSIMVTQDSTKVIDPEFAFYGPMGFDLGAVLSNLFLSYFSQQAHRPEDQDYQKWILEQIISFYNTFQAVFEQLWRQQQIGCDYNSTLIIETELRNTVLADYMKQLFTDSLQFTAAKMIRRILGIAHVEDLESIKDTVLRAKCERNALVFARELLVNTNNFDNIEATTIKAEQQFNN